MIKLPANKLNSLLSVFDQGLVSGCSFLVAFILGRHLPLEHFGMHVLLFAVWVFINNLQIGFINQGLYVLMNSGEKNFKECISVIQYVFSILILVLLLLAAFAVPYLIDISPQTLQVFAISVFCSNLKEFDRNFALAESKVKKIVVYDGLILLFTLAGLAALIFTNTLSLDSAWAVIGIASLTVVVADFIYDRKSFNFNRNEIARVFQVNNKFSVWTLCASVNTWFNSNFYKFIAAGALSLKTVAVMGAAQQIVYLVNPIAFGLQNYNIGYLTKIKSKEPERFNEEYRKYAVQFLLLLLPVLAVLSIFPSQFLSLFYKDKYIGYEYVLQLFCLLMFLSIVIRVIQLPSTIAKRTRLLFYIQISVTVITLTLLLVYFKGLGIVGFLSYLLLSNILILVGNVFLLKKISAFNSPVPSFENKS